MAMGVCCQVSLYCDCPLWPDEGMCAMRDCSVCECEDHEVPKPWKEAEAGAGEAEVACDSAGDTTRRHTRAKWGRC